MNPFSRKTKLANEMAHQQSYSAEPYREGMDFTDEAWAYGLRALPGSLANQLQALGEYTTGKDYPNKLGNYLDELTQVNEMGYTPQNEYEKAVAFLPELVYDPALIAGTPYAAYKGIRNAPKLLNTLSDDMLTTPMRNQLGMITWQGSPHKYDGRLDPTKIGTGEGAQAYGYGHYLAENPDTAEFYRDALSGGEITVVDSTGVKITIPIQKYNGEGDVVQVYASNDFETAKKITTSDEWINNLPPQKQEAAKRLANTLAYSRSTDVSTGHLYKFDLDDNAIANMLDWDAPLSEQPEAVRNAFLDMNQEWLEDSRNMTGVMSRNINDAINDQKSTVHKITGQDIYKQAVRDFGPKEASDLFAQYGSSGIKYFDGSSRSAGEGTRNFVLFPGNENLVTPLERNGEPLGNLGALLNKDN